MGRHDLVVDHRLRRLWALEVQPDRPVVWVDTVTQVLPLPVPASVTSWAAYAIGGATKGPFTIGGSAAYSGNHSAVTWRASVSNGTLSISAPAIVNQELAVASSRKTGASHSETKCPTDTIDGINAAIRMIGDAYCSGTNTDDRSQSWAYLPALTDSICMR